MDFWSTSAFLWCVLLTLPFPALLLGLFLGESDGEWPHIREYLLTGYVLNTLWLVGVVAALSVLMAVPAAWLTSHFDFPGRKWLEWAMVLPLAIPTYVAAFVYKEIPHAATPLLMSVRDRFGPDAFLLAEGVIRKGTLAVFMAGVLYPYLYLSLRASFRVQRKGVVEAAHLLGRGPSSVFFSVALPLARPALIAGLGLIVMEVVNDYGAVHFFSVPTLTVGIFRAWTDFGDLGSAVRLAGAVLGGVLLLFLVEHLQRGRAKFAEEVSDSTPLRHRRLGRLPGIIALAACGIPLFIGFVYPIVRLSLWAAQSWDRVNLSIVGELVGNSLALALGTAILLTVLSVWLAYANRLHANRRLRRAIAIASTGYAIPGAVIAVGMMTLAGFIQPHVGGLMLTGSVGVIGFAYMVRFLAVALHPVRAAMERTCGSLDAASRLLGHSPLDTLWRVNLPLVRGTLVSVTMLVFVDILKELPLTMILRPANFETLAIHAYSLAWEDRIPECAVPSLMIIVLAGLGLFALNKLDSPSRATP